jgi:hypothetical protein
VNSSDTTTDQAAAQGRFGPYTYQVERFLSAVKGNFPASGVGYGDHVDEDRSDRLWNYRREFLADHADDFNAVLDVLEDEGTPKYSPRAMAAIIAQDSLSEEQRELLYAPYRCVIPWDELTAPREEPNPNSTPAEPQYDYVYADGVKEALKSLSRHFDDLAERHRLTHPHPESEYAAGAIAALKIAANTLRDELRFPLFIYETPLVKFQRVDR